MDWLSKPKVLLGLIVNGVYLLFCLATPSSQRPPHAYSHPLLERSEPAAQGRPLPYVPLPPPSKASKAESYYVSASDQLLVYLSNDLTLVNRPGHKLLLWLSFSVKNKSGEEPRGVFLRFVSRSRITSFSPDSQLVITADGVLKWPHGQSNEPAQEAPWRNGGKLPYSIELDQNGVVETMGTEIPYADFIDIISARRVVVSLGPDRVELTPDQVEALRDMHRKLPQPPPPVEVDPRH